MSWEYDISIVGGLGHVGLPLGLAFANAGKKVVAIDTSAERAALVSNKIMPFLENGAQESLDRLLNKSFFVSKNISSAAKSSHIIITAGTPLNSNFDADLSQIESILYDLVPQFSSGQTIILRSTVSPNTTEYVKQYIEINSKFSIGTDLYLAMVPERIAQGDSLIELQSLPNIIGAFDEGSYQRAKSLFEQLCKDTFRCTPLEAELTKLFANNLRYISFAISNEFFMISDQLGANPYKIFDMVNMKYPRGGLKQPGFAKGPCLGKDAWLLTNAVPNLVSSTGLTNSAYRVNEALPVYCFNRIKDKTSLKGKTTAILGLTFKRDSDDTRDSLSIKLLQLMKSQFLNVITHDPYVDEKNLEEVIKISDVAIIAMNHSQYEGLSAKKILDIAGRNTLVCDPWNICKTDRFIFWTYDA